MYNYLDLVAWYAAIYVLVVLSVAVLLDLFVFKPRANRDRSAIRELDKMVRIHTMVVSSQRAAIMSGENIIAYTEVREHRD